MTFRPARLSDLPAICALRRAAADALTRRFGFGHWSRISVANTLRRVLRPGAPTLFVLEDGGRIAATCTLDRETPAFYRRCGFARPGDPALYLRSMSVHPALQGQGAGRRFMDAVEDHARRLGCAAVRLDAYAHAAGAGGFYAKCGYAPVSGGTLNGVALRLYEKRITKRITVAEARRYRAAI